jgi:hypothetical protein
MAAKRKRVVLSIEDKLKVLDRLDKGASLAAMADQFGVPVCIVHVVRPLSCCKRICITHIRWVLSYPNNFLIRTPLPKFPPQRVRIIGVLLY